MLRESLAARGHEVLSLVAGHRDDAAPAGGATVRFVSEGTVAALLRRPARLLSAARAFAPDVVQVHGLSYPVQTWWLTCGRFSPVIVQDHAGRPPVPAWRRRLLRRALSRVRGLMVTAAAQADEYRRAGVLPLHARVWEVVETSSTFTPGDRDHARAVTGLSGEPCVLWVGHLDENKDPMTALAVLSQAAESLPRLRAWFVFASAPLAKAVRSRIGDDQRLAGRVTLLGEMPLARMESHFRAADILLHPSRREGGSSATIEALACGVTPVVADIPSQRAIVGDAGAFFQPGDAAAAAEALVRTARGDAPARRARARRRFDDALSYEIMAARLEQIYLEATGW